MVSKGFDPIALSAATEKVVVDGARRKYVQIGRPLRFYGGTTSATEVGCNLRCKFCFSDKPVWKPKETGKFYTSQEVFDGLAKSARKHGHKIISASASEGTIGRQHLMELLDLVENSEFVYVLETNGMILGNDPEYAQALAKYSRLHVRVSIKGDNPEQFHDLTGAHPDSYELPYKALHLSPALSPPVGSDERPLGPVHPHELLSSHKKGPPGCGEEVHGNGKSHGLKIHRFEL